MPDTTPPPGQPDWTLANDLAVEPAKSIPLHFDRDPDCGCTPPCFHGIYQAAAVPGSLTDAHEPVPQDSIAAAEQWTRASGLPAHAPDVRAWLDRLGVPVPVGIHTLMDAVRRAVIATGDAAYRQGWADKAVGVPLPRWAQTPAQSDGETCTGCGDDIWPGERVTADGLCAVCAVKRGAPPAAEPDGSTDPEWTALLHRAYAGGAGAGRAVCQAYSRGVRAGVERCAPPTTPQPGPQDIPSLWLAALVRAADNEHYNGLPLLDVLRDTSRFAYRLGFAAHAGCEITVSDEGDQVYIGDRAEPAGTVPRIATLAWDHRDQPDLTQLARILQDLADLHLTQINTGSDDYGIAISTTPITQEQAYQAWTAPDQP